MKQLKMRRYGGAVTERPLPEGYRFELFSGSITEIKDWLNICLCGLNPDTEMSRFEDAVIKCSGIEPCKDLFFVVDPYGKRIATTTCRKADEGVGGVHMVAALEDYRGKGIGHAMITHAVNILARRGYKIMTLTTDDFRLAAVKTYLDAGFCPLLIHDDESDMRKRWDDVLEKLGYTGKVEYLEP